MMNLRFSAAVLALAGLAAPLAAQPAGGPPPIPSNRAEVEQSAAQRFAMVDRNGDGYMTADELGDHATMALGALDTDHDGKISRTEAVTGMLATFDRIDADHDGTLSDAERGAVRMAPGSAPPPSGH